MSKEDLMRLSEPRRAKLSTRGSNWRQMELEIPTSLVGCSPELRMISSAIRNVFNSKNVYANMPVMFWYDEMAGLGDANGQWEESPWAGIYIFGTLFSRDTYDEPQVSHIFLRKLDGFLGQLDQWRDDLTFPAETRQFSVCAVIPKDYVYRGFEMRDFHNNIVTQYLAADIAAYRIDVNVLAEFIREYGSPTRET